MRSSNNRLIRFFYRYPSVSTPGEAAKFVAKQVAGGADYTPGYLGGGAGLQ
jgi:hypothetical protein